MRLNRTKTRKSNNGMYLKILGVGMLICILAVSIGYFGTKYYLFPKFLTSQNESAGGKVVKKNLDKQPQKNVNEQSLETNKKEVTTDTSSEQSTENKLYTFEVPPLSIYNVQVGSFDEKKYAQNHIKDINDKGLAGYIVESERYRVIVMSFVERSSADQFKTSIKEHYSDAFISQKQLPTREIGYDDNGKAYSEVASKEINELKKHYENYSKFISSNDVSSIESNEILKFVDSEINRLDRIMKAMSAVSPSDDFTNFNSKFQSIVKGSMTKLTEIKKSNFADRTKLFEILMESMNSYEGLI